MNISWHEFVIFHLLLPLTFSGNEVSLRQLLLLDYASSNSSSFRFEILLYKTKADKIQNKKLAMF